MEPSHGDSLEIKKILHESDWGEPLSLEKSRKLLELFATSGMSEKEAEQKVKELKFEKIILEQWQGLHG